MNPTMTHSAREAFLADTHVGVLAVGEPGRGPCAVPVWYRYTPGQAIRITVPGGSRKVPLLRAAGRASLCVQVETLPYKYVSVEGPVELFATDPELDQREMAERYLGPTLGQRYLAATAANRRNELLLLLHPKRWWSVDFAKLEL